MNRARQRARRTWLVALAAAVALAPTVARAEINFKFAGHISSDIRYRLWGEPIPATYPSQYEQLKFGFSRNENRVRVAGTASIGRKVTAKADIEMVYYGFSDLNDISAMTMRERVDPYFFEAHAAYVDVYRVLPGLDLRVGRQIVRWGASDLFNPTNNLNPFDFSDPMLFGRALANNMIRLDYNPKDDWVITAVWVPVFRPSQVPRSAPLALNRVDRPAPVQEALYRRSLATLAEVMPPSRIDVSTLQPDTSIENSQVGVRVQGRVLDQDVSLSYYHGRFNLPSLAWTINHADGVAEAGIVWPRMDVVGFDIAGSIEKLGGVGYWIEGAVIFPQEIKYGIYNDLANGQRIPVTFNPVNGDPLLNSTGKMPTVVPSTPFVKVTAGADYSIGQYVYLNFQYVHGFVDEFGYGVTPRLPNKAGANVRLEQAEGDYIVAGMDLKFLRETLLIRLFGVYKLPSFSWTEGFDKNYKPCGVVYPQITWKPWDSTELILGAFIFLGDQDTKFGDPQVGASEIFGKARFWF